MLKKALVVLAVALVAFLGFVATRPDSYVVQRSIDVAAPAEVVMAQLDDFHAWPAWSPWEKLDPNMKKTFEGPARGVGASYSWQGNKDVGKGKMTILEEDAPKRIRYKLEFIEPFESIADTEFLLASSEGDTALTTVTWKMSGESSFISKLFGVFMDMDAMIGADFERGLGQLKAVAEAKAR